jgi:murein DD-endopeptidase MepM/ murein hydrolase activator NlpD
MFKRIATVLLVAAWLLPAPSVYAQEGELPTYIVQPGDTINLIAIRFNVPPADLIAVNDLTNPDILPVGSALKIPGLEGVSGELTTQAIALGQNLTRLSRANQISPDILISINRITSPNEIYAGSTLIIPTRPVGQPRMEIQPLESGQSFLEYALIQGVNPWTVAAASQKNRPARILPKEPVFALNAASESHFWASPLVADIQVLPLPLVQGKTITIRVEATRAVKVEGELNNMALHFFPAGENEWIALQGVHAMAEPGLANFSLDISSPEGDAFLLEQPLLLEPGYYPQDPALYVDPQTIDTAITQPEDELIRSIISSFTPEQYWSGVFRVPVDDPPCIKSWFGNRRSYNNSPYTYFHTGVDYGVCANLNIYAPAAGVVVYTGELTVRGNATIIDHGLGVYSGIWHQKSISVNVGDRVEPGQLIGEIGSTGRVTGPHLHWEVWVNGVQVEPLDWLETEFPMIPNEG